MAVSGYRQEVTGSNPVSPHARFLFQYPRLVSSHKQKKPPASFTDGSNYLRFLLASEQLAQWGVNALMVLPNDVMTVTGLMSTGIALPFSVLMNLISASHDLQRGMIRLQ